MRRHVFTAVMAVVLLFTLSAHAHEGHGSPGGAPAKPFSMEDLYEKARRDAASPTKDSKAAEHADHEAGDKDEAEAEIKIIEGEFIDISCNTIHQSEGPDHASCAEKCAAAGMPVALRDAKDGKLYLLITEEHFVNAAGPALGKMGQKVIVKAKVLKNANIDMIVPVTVELAKATPGKGGKPAKKP